MLGASASLVESREVSAREGHGEQRAEFMRGSLAKQAALVASSLAAKPLVSSTAKRPLDTAFSFRTATQVMPVLRFFPVGVLPLPVAPEQAGVPLVGVVEIRV